MATLALLLFVAGQIPGGPTPSNLPYAKEAERVLRVLEACPSYDRYRMAIDADRSPSRRPPRLVAVDEAMRRLQAVPTRVLTTAARILWAQSNEQASPYYTRFRRQCVLQNPELATLGEDAKEDRIRYLATTEAEKLFFVDRFLFDAPADEPFRDRPEMHHSSAQDAIHGHTIDRLYPFGFELGRGFYERTKAHLPVANVFTAIGEYDFYSTHYRRRSNWWASGTPRR